MQRKVFIPEGLTVNHPFFYIIQHLPSGKYYAGIKYQKTTCDSSILMSKEGYQTSSKIVAEIIIKDGVEAFTTNRVRHFETRDEALKYEKRFLSKINARKNNKFFNMTNGDVCFYANCWTEARKNKKKPPMSEEQKQKLSIIHKGRIISEETKQKMRNARKNKPLTEKQKLHLENMSKSHKGRPRSEETKRKLSVAHKGKPRSEETKEKMRKPKSEEHKRRMREVNMGKKLSPESIMKREATRKLNYAIKHGVIS